MYYGEMSFWDHDDGLSNMKSPSDVPVFVAVNENEPGVFVPAT